MLVGVGLLYAYSAVSHSWWSWGPPNPRPELEARRAARFAGYAAVLILGGIWVLGSMLRGLGRQSRHCAGRAGFEAVQTLVTQAGLPIEGAEYHHLAFGSWSIRVAHEPPTRLAWDGKEEMAILEVETDALQEGRPTWQTIWTGSRKDEQSARNVVKVLLEQVRQVPTS
jgi:hypothetical protein